MSVFEEGLGEIGKDIYFLFFVGIFGTKEKFICGKKMLDLVEIYFFFLKEFL